MWRNKKGNEAFPPQSLRGEYRSRPIRSQEVFYLPSNLCIFNYLCLARFHLALAAVCAIALRRFEPSFLARAFPPFNPPSRPRATAAGFFSLVGSVVASWTMDAASWLGSVGFLERLGMPHDSIRALSWGVEMDRTEIVVTWIAILLVVLSFLYVPWVLPIYGPYHLSLTDPPRWAWFWSPPDPVFRMDLGIMTIEWALIFLVALNCVRAIRRRRPN